MTMRNRWLFALLAGALLLTSGASLLTLLQAQRGPDAPQWPGPAGDGVVLLPNGWRIAPAGRHLAVGDLPLAMVPSPDGRSVIVTNNGWSSPSLTIVDQQRMYVRARVPLNHAWLGLVWHPDGNRLYSSGAGFNTVKELTYANGRLKETAEIALAAPPDRPRGGFSNPRGHQFIGGLAVTPDGRHLFAVHVFGEALSVVDTAARKVLRRVELPAEPYTCVVSPDGKLLYVSLWGGAKVLVFDTDSLERVGEIAVGEHPNAMVFSKDARRLFVACANTNAVWAIDLASRSAKEQISMSLYSNAPAGSTPNGLRLSPDGETLLVANADNNTVAVVDVATPGASNVDGFIPTGWYPTDVMFSGDGKRLFILSGKGLTSQSNPRGPEPGSEGAPGQYIAQLLQGSLSVVAMPDRATLEAYTKRVYGLTRYTDDTRLAPSGAPAASSIPRKVGEPSPIKHVFYVIRENRTYDQVLGDMERGNGDPTLCILGEEVTPNAHAIARDFVLFDNFYVDAEVSYDGHAWSTGAYATDFVEKIWPTNYGGRGAIYLSEGGGKMRNAYGNVTAPAQGYIWDACKRAGVSVRSYGEFAERIRTEGSESDAAKGGMRATVPGLAGLVHPEYPPFDLDIPDGTRVDIWLKEFREFEKNGRLPGLSIIRIGGDHTLGTRPGAPTPRAMVAENDLALGRVVEAISTSPYWKESAIFVLEDDAQNGPDHVDAHRSVALVISPFAKRGVVDSTLYTTSSVLRTMELILGVPPMTQYDAAAAPMYNAFQATPNPAPFRKIDPRVPIDERNEKTAYGAEASLRMNLEVADVAPELELNEIIWKSIRGASSPMPPPVRSAFIRSIGDDDSLEPARGAEAAERQRAGAFSRREARSR